MAPSTTSYSPPATNELLFPNLISSPPVLVFYAGFLTQRNVKSPRYPTEKRCIDTPIGHHGPFATFSPDSECVCMPSYQYLSHHLPSRCQRCRSRKVKCSGVQPCDHCRRRGQTCVFDEDRKIVVSEGCALPPNFLWEPLLIGVRLFMSMKRKLEAREGSDPTFDSNKRPRVLDSLGMMPVSIPLLTTLLSEQPEPRAETPAESTTEAFETQRSEERFVSNPLVSSSYLRHNGQTQRTWCM